MKSFVIDLYKKRMYTLTKISYYKTSNRTSVSLRSLKAESVLVDGEELNRSFDSGEVPNEAGEAPCEACKFHRLL